MRSIQVSNAVYLELLKRAHESDSTDEDVLRRILGMPISPVSGYAPALPPAFPDFAGAFKPFLENTAGVEPGYADTRFGVTFPQGFKIHRFYKGDYYEAVAVAGNWILAHDNSSHESLNKLNKAVGAITENAWSTWFFERNGKEFSIDTLRDQKKIIRRATD